jgi:hypothetical protein
MTPKELAEGVFEVRRRFYSWRSIGSRVLGADTPFSPFRAGITTIANVISRREIYKKQNRRLGV